MTFPAVKKNIRNKNKEVQGREYALWEKLKRSQKYRNTAWDIVDIIILVIHLYLIQKMQHIQKIQQTEELQLILNKQLIQRMKLISFKDEII